MGAPAYSGILTATLAAVVGCGGGNPTDESGAGGGGADYYVNAATGGNGNPGTAASPFKTVTYAMGVAVSGKTVQVAPGTYDAANGETFPISVPAGVRLIGDEINKGGGGSPTSLVGGGQAPTGAPGFLGVTLLPGAGSTIAGFTITNDAVSFTYPMGLILGSSTVTLRNTTVTGAFQKTGVYIINGSVNHVITGNRIVNNGSLIVNNASPGLGFIGGGAGSKVESNIITGNAYGVEYDSDGGDLGGGSAGSAGGNVISCNTVNDIWTNSSVTMVPASNNFWDHVAPTLGCTPGTDICIFTGTATIVTTGAALATNPCT